MQYFRLNKTQEDEDFYFSHNGLFNFWNQYLILHWYNVNFVIINKPGTKFGKEHFPTSALYTALNHIEDDYCGNCNNNICDVVKDFGECILPKVSHALSIYRERLFASGDAYQQRWKIQHN